MSSAKSTVINTFYAFQDHWNNAKSFQMLWSNACWYCHVFVRGSLLEVITMRFMLFSMKCIISSICETMFLGWAIAFDENITIILFFVHIYCFSFLWKLKEVGSSDVVWKLYCNVEESTNIHIYGWMQINIYECLTLPHWVFVNIILYVYFYLIIK